MSPYESLFEKEQNNEHKYSLKHAKLDRTFMYHLKAVFFMRWNTQKRNYKGLVSEMVLPAVIALIGILITRVKFDYV